MKNLNFYPIKIEEQDEGGFLASCPTIQGAWAEGETIKAAVDNLSDIVGKVLDYRKNEPSPYPAVEIKDKIKIKLPNLALAVEL